MLRRSTKVMLLIMLLVHLALGVGSAGAAESIREAIVKIYSVYNTPDYFNPWNMQGPRGSTGSGAVIEGNRIITNAHVVSDLTFLQVRKYGDTERYMASVTAISHQSDLAIIEVDDPSFFAGIEPLRIGDLPETHKEVTVYGFPMGGDTLSLTKGIVSRIEHQPYVHSSLGLLAGQIDAAINPGNSGGPVIVDGELVGVIMQGIPAAQNLGYMVPTPIIRHFLDGVEAGEYRGFPSIGIIWQRMENPALRAAHQMEPGQTGVRVTRIFPGSPADGPLQPGDVVLAFDDYIIANDGTVEFRSRERTNLAYVVQKYQVGETMEVTLLRDGVEQTIPIQLHRPAEENWLVPQEQYETLPTYYIYGGLVFSPLSKDLLRIWGDSWPNIAPPELVSMYRNNVPENPGDQVVILLRVLADAVNTGYEGMNLWVVSSVNGEPISNMAEFVRSIESSDSDQEFMIFENATGQQVVLDRAGVAEAHQRILNTYRVPADRSDDLMAADH